MLSPRQGSCIPRDRMAERQTPSIELDELVRQLSSEPTADRCTTQWVPLAERVPYSAFSPGVLLQNAAAKLRQSVSKPTRPNICC
jgi:hypothetical protein